MKKGCSAEVQALLAGLAAMSDDDIDTDDIPEAPVENWALAKAPRPLPPAQAPCHHAARCRRDRMVQGTREGAGVSVGDQPGAAQGGGVGVRGIWMSVTGICEKNQSGFSTPVF